MDMPLSPAENLVTDANGRIDQDVACIKCGYNLRGLDPNQLCPECATPVGRSTLGDLLQFCDPDWVEKLARGMRWIVAGIVVGIIGGILFGLGTAALGARRGGPPMSPSLIGMLMLIPGLIGMIGLWMVTEPESRRVFSYGSSFEFARCSVPVRVALCG